MNNLKRRVMNLTPIDDWHSSLSSTRENVDNLTDVFLSFLETNNVFYYIWVAVRDNPSYNEQEEHFSYYNVGFTPEEITKYFALRFGLNYFAYNFHDPKQIAILKEKMGIIYKANLYTYRKLIESMGYQYNPLFNVDGVELYSNAEALGNSTTTRDPDGYVTTHTGGGITGNLATTNKHFINPSNDNTESASFMNDKTVQDAVTTNQDFSNYDETSTLSHTSADNYKYNSTSGEWEKDGLFGIKKSDVAFGIDFGGPERFYAEKRIRQGNIGVTKSTELIRDQRDLVKFNILDVFIKDLEKDLVVGIF